MTHRLSLAAVLAFVLSLPAASAAQDGNPADPPRNIILFIADGAGPSHFTMGRGFSQYLSGRTFLHLDPFLTGAVITHSAKERVTDSASSATAYAAGIKTYNAAIAVDTLQHPVETVLEAAERLGLATGLVATSRITHATPASFSSHVPERGMENEIAEQQIEQGIELILGGGRRHFRPESQGGLRDDDRDLLAEARRYGYRVVADEDSLAAIHSLPVLGLFAESHIPYVVDRTDTAFVSLADMTRKAIELLSREDMGFFLMVEGSRIDHASHENDAAAALHEVLGYDEAFAEALAFAERDGNTLLIGVSDHETGGLSLGRSLVRDDAAVSKAPTYWQSLYGAGRYEWRPDVLAGVGSSAVAMASMLEETGADVASVFEERAGIDDLTDEEVEAISIARQRGFGLHYVIGEIISRRAVIGWTTVGHTAEDVGLYAYGPGSDALKGVVDNTFIGQHIFRMLGVDRVFGGPSSPPR